MFLQEIMTHISLTFLAYSDNIKLGLGFYGKVDNAAPVLFKDTLRKKEKERKKEREDRKSPENIGIWSRNL